MTVVTKMIGGARVACIKDAGSLRAAHNCADVSRFDLPTLRKDFQIGISGLHAYYYFGRRWLTKICHAAGQTKSRSRLESEWCRPRKKKVSRDSVNMSDDQLSPLLSRHSCPYLVM